MILSVCGLDGPRPHTTPIDCQHVSADADYMDAIGDAVAIVETHAHLCANRAENLFVRVLLSELRSLTPAARAERDRSRVDTLETIVDKFADRIVEGAAADVASARESNATRGNVCASVSFSFPETTRWLRYAAQRGNKAAKRLLVYINNLRAPSIATSDEHSAIVYEMGHQSQFGARADQECSQGEI